MVLTDQQIAPIDTQARRAVAFRAGDTVRVHQKIVEKDKTRIQVFEGTVLARKHGTEPGATFTVRRVGTDGIAVEKIFPLYTPTIDRIEVVQQVKTRRAKLYFLRGRTPKQIREKLRNTFAVFKDAPDDTPEPEAQQQGQEEAKTDAQPKAQQDEQPKQEEQTTPPTEEQPKQEEKSNDTPEQTQPEQPTDTPTPDKQSNAPQDTQPQPESNQEQAKEEQPDTPTQPTNTTPQPEEQPKTPDGTKDTSE